MSGSRFIATVTPSRFIKVAAPQPKPPGLAHAHPACPPEPWRRGAFSKFLTAHPRISRFVAEHPRASRFLFRAASHIPVVNRFIPIAPHIAPVYNATARKTRRPTLKLSR